MVGQNIRRVATREAVNGVTNKTFDGFTVGDILNMPGSVEATRQAYRIIYEKISRDTEQIDLIIGEILFTDLFKISKRANVT